MIRVLALVLCLACTPTSPPPADLGPLTRAVEAWTAEPGPETLEEVAIVAARAVDHAGHSRETDLELARVLNDILLRPDMARPLVEPYHLDLSEPESGLWLNVLLRSDDLRTFSAELTRLKGISVDPKQSALRSAAAQAALHREIDWERAVYAHRAAALIDRLPQRGRKTLDMPFADFPHAVQLLAELLPDQPFSIATARSTRTEDPVPGVDPGAIPAMEGRRRVFGWARSTDPAALQALLDRTVKDKYRNTVSFSLVIERPDGSERQLCGEGRREKGTYWCISACDPMRQATWMEAAAVSWELKQRGLSDQERITKVRERFPSGVLGSD